MNVMPEIEAPRPLPGIRVTSVAAFSAAIEWYDFFLYGTAAALVFPRLFFPPELPLFIAQIAAFGTFSVGFIARPLGGAIFGHLGDLRGRKTALVIAMTLMGIATTAIGLLPGYAAIGSFAPLALIVLRFAQGLAVGGQWGAAALLAIESAPRHRQGLFSSFVQIGVPSGVVLANTVFLIVSALTSSAAFVVWGWRIGFLLSVSLIAIGLYIYRTISDPGGTPTQSQTSAVKRPAPIVSVLRHHGGTVLLAGGSFIANNVCFYITITYVIAYGTTSAGLSRDLLLSAVMAGSVAMIPALIACGALSDRFGRRSVFVAGAILSGMWAFAFFPLIRAGSSIAVTAAITIELVFVSLMYGPQAALFAELFPKAVRYSGASLGYQIGTVVGGGLSPIIATALLEHYGSTGPIALYMAATCAISLVCVLFLGNGKVQDDDAQSQGMFEVNTEIA
jgi:MFS family permease